MPEYLIRFAQAHESFRLPELKALAELTGIELEILSYSQFTPYCIVKLQNEATARSLIARSVLAKDIFELWGEGTNYEDLHADIRSRTAHRWNDCKDVSFRFTVECFAGKRDLASKRDIIQSFAYLGFEGPIRMKNPDEDFWVLEEYLSDPEAIQTKGVSLNKSPHAENMTPRKIYFGRWLADSSREMVNRYDLKKRRYISTTSMDAELALVTANMAHAAPGKIFFDPFVGTGSFCVAAAHYGALTVGSDIDPRSFRGREKKKGELMGLALNYEQYGLMSKFVNAFSADLTNTPLRNCQFLDGIVCDPPYGVREGLKVLGSRDGKGKEPVMIDGVPAHTLPGYVPPKKQYGFETLQLDILDFAVRTLVPDGRLSMWMPTADEEEVELGIPMHENLEVVGVSVQPFNKWSRRLITYRRLPEGQTSDVSLGRRRGDAHGTNADDLNEFRRKYFTKRQDRETPTKHNKPSQ